MEADGGNVENRLFSYLRTHPIVTMLFFTPGIVEYLSGSSKLSLLATSPVFFFILLMVNVALYGPGVLLIREAMIRWRKGWATVLLLGGAYAIVEEGVMLNTFYDPLAGPVGPLGFWGHWMGVNWVWLSELLIVHMLWSIALPILLLDLAIPETHGQRLLSEKGIRWAFLILAANVSIVGFGSWSNEVKNVAGPLLSAILLSGSLIAIVLLVIAARAVRSDLLVAASETPRHGPLAFALVGLGFFPALLFSQTLVMGAGGPPLLSILLIIVAGGVWLYWILNNIGHCQNRRAMVALSLGLVVPIMMFGVVSQITMPIVLAGDAALLLFFRWLWQKHAAGKPVVPPGIGT